MSVINMPALADYVVDQVRLNAGLPPEQREAREAFAPRRYSVEKLMRFASEHCQVDPDLVFSKSRVVDVVRARWVGFNLCHRHYHYSTPEIADGAGMGSHSTVVAALDRATVDQAVKAQQIYKWLVGLEQDWKQQQLEREVQG